MIPTTLTKEQLEKFQVVKDKFLKETQLPKANMWRAMSDDDIWLSVVSQVVVVGKEAPAKRLSDDDIQPRLAFATLASLPLPDAANALGTVLAKIGTRYVSKKQPRRSPKVKALLKNLSFLKNFHGGPHGFVKHLSGMTASRDRIDYISKNFSFIKAKGARDFLTTGLGMATDVIALDSRVMGIVRLIIPRLTNPLTIGNYDAIEDFLIKRVCKPLGISAMEFDQLLFHNDDDIKMLLCDSALVPDRPCLAISGSSSCRTGKQPFAARMDRR